MELEFRAYDKNAHEYIHKDESTLTFTMQDLAEGCIYKPSICITEQSTGLSDKNEKKIFIGDVLKNTEDNIVYVFFRNGCSMVNAETTLYKFITASPVEIIGNIHDDAALLEKEN